MSSTRSEDGASAGATGKIGFGIGQKLTLSFLAVGIIIVLGMLVYQYHTQREENEAMLKEMDGMLREAFDRYIRYQVETAYTMTDRLHKLSQEGELTPEQARAVATHLIRDVRYGLKDQGATDGYFWADTKEGVNVALLGRKEVEGKSRNDLKDANGKLLVQELRKAALAGGDFTDYWFPRPGQTEAKPKRGYTLYHEPFDMVIGTGAYTENIDNIMTEKRSQREQELNAAIRNQLLVGAGGILLVIIVAVYFSRMIARPILTVTHNLDAAVHGDSGQDVAAELRQRGDEIGRLAHAVQLIVDGERTQAGMCSDIAGGNWNQSITLRSDNDRLGMAMQQMIDKINETLAAINDAAVQVGSGSSQLSDASQSLSQATTESAASLQEITASITEIGSQTRQNSENAQQANHLATAARTSAAKGGERMEEMNSAMHNLNESAQKIAKIIKVIDEIAFQTNLLALNAAVEAARAGRHGKGFAVVAEEVRSLAGRSAKAARETAELLESNGQLVGKANTIANQTGEALTEIVEGITKVADLVGEIAAASHEQAQGVAQIGQGLSQIETVTQQNTAHAEETASVAEELSSQAQMLREILRQFRLKGGVTAQSAPARQSPRVAAPKPAAKPAAPRSLPLPSKKKEPLMVDPREEIQLDDDEFGKF